LCAQLRRPQRDMYPGVAVGRGRPWAFPLAFSTFGLYVGLLVGIFTGDLLFTLTTAFVGAFLGAALYARAGTAHHRLAVLQRALGPDHYRFYVSMEWPIDGLLQFVLDRLVARGLMVFPIAPGFVGIPKEAIARLRYGYVIGPLDRQLLVLQTMEGTPGAFAVRGAIRPCYIIVVRPFKRGTPPGEDPVVRTVAQLLWEFELLRWRKGFPPTVPMRWLDPR
jgi:hypothetical protein